MGYRITFDGKRRPQDEYEADLKTNEFASKWKDGTVVDLDDLTPNAINAIAEAEGVGWPAIYYSPAANIDRFQRVLEACAAQAGIDPPEPAETMGAFVDRFDNWLEVTQPIDEQPFTDGFPPQPGEPESGSTSTSPGGMGGHQK